MTEKIGYKLNPKKLKGASQSILPFVVGAFYYTEDFEYFDIIKPYLDIPEPRKTLEEIQQELEEKFDKLIEKTHLEYRIGHDWLYKKQRYDDFCKKQDEDFEYAKENGKFPEKHTLTYCDNPGVNSFTYSFAIKQGNKHEGYYTFGGGYYKFYMPYKPNMILRWFVNKCFSFRWVDEK
jgi:hypothetical protein